MNAIHRFLPKQAKDAQKWTGPLQQKHIEKMQTDQRMTDTDNVYRQRMH
jgi:hypothetical protein